jgi:outer membrane receptor protein involved in Fe transport
MKTKIASTIFLLIFGVLISSAQTGKIAGTITDKTTHEALIGVNIVIKGTPWGAISDVEGKYFILNVPPGDYDVAASLLGYQSVTQQNVSVNISRTTTADFELDQTTIDLKQEVIVNAVRPDVQREKTSTSEFIRNDEVQVLPAVTTLQTMLSLSADVVDGHFRGGRDGEELYNLNGMGIVNPLSNSAAFLPTVSAIEEVEVITSGMLAQYGNAQSGVVNISMKEGSRKNWDGRAEIRTRLPSYKHFGANIFDESANPYLQLLNSPEKWNGSDSSNPGTKYYSTISFGFDSRYKDSTQASQIAYAMWKQARRDLNTSYDNLTDYSVDVTLGGPLSDISRLFIAARLDNEWDFIPTLEPNVTRQVMGNVAYDIPGGISLKVSGAFSEKRENLLAGVGSSSYSAFYNWIWNRPLYVSRSLESNNQFGIRFAQTLSARTFYDIKINRLKTSYQDGAPAINPERYVSDQNIAMWRYFNTPDFFRVASTDNDFDNEQSTTTSLDASFTSQVTNSHLLNTGLQMNFYDVNVANRRGLSTPGAEQYEAFSAKPVEAALYLQDKMEFEGMIANIGLRADYYDQRVNYYTDPFFPYRSFDSTGIPVYDPALAPTEKSPAVFRIQPRIGISFPVSVSTVFHMNYGSYLQRPSFNRTLYSRVARSNLNTVRLGNPQLKPEDTKSYDVGVTQGLGEGFTLDVSGYYKDVANLIQLANFYDSQNFSYQTFVNRDYADIRGFSLSLRKRQGWFTGSIKYRYEVATGKSATPFNATPSFYEPRGENTQADQLPSPKDILMDFDRTHNVVFNFVVKTDDEWGPVIAEFYPLENIIISSNSFIRSGRPYTYSTQGLNLVNNKRTPMEQNTNLKVSKQVKKMFGVNATVYVDITNLFNQKIYNYATVFQTVTATSSQSSSNNQNIIKYETDRSSLLYYDANLPFLVNQEFLLYSNEPRAVYVGLVFNF